MCACQPYAGPGEALQCSNRYSNGNMAQQLHFLRLYFHLHFWRLCLESAIMVEAIRRHSPGQRQEEWKGWAEVGLACGCTRTALILAAQEDCYCMWARRMAVGATAASNIVTSSMAPAKALSPGPCAAPMRRFSTQPVSISASCIL